ncbi:MAG: lysine--tRNA ligase, partial [Atopobiaceae bacterium]|nr:lysine--tRNA ligase [Atopobiaceae bacterium]
MSDQTESKAITPNAAADAAAIETTDERALRRAKRQALIDAGVDPYPSKTHVTHRAAELESAYEELEAGADTEDVVCVAGRIRAIRKQGKAAFVVVEDATGSIQLFCRINVLGEAGWEVLGTFDVGDIVEATGTIVRTRRGELSVSPTELVLLTKAIRPLPEKFHGLSDKETRYRQRYVDLIMNPEVKSTFVKRAKILSTIRNYMAEQGYMEMDTPILQEIQGGATARPFTTHFNALNQDCYLRIATELHLKRLLVGGFERVFEIGRIFRNEGMDPTHNPEFTSMEAYCAYADTEDMKRLSEGLFKAACLAVHDSLRFSYQGVEVDLSGEWRSATMVELVSERVGEQITIDTPLERLRAICYDNGIQPDLAWGAGKLIFELYDELVESTIIDPTFVCDYPLEVSPLAKKLPDEPRMTGRFELVIAGKEFANAFTELNDPVDQEERFAAQMETKAAGDGEAMEYDSDFIRALEYGMPPAGGIGYGIDRIVMLLTDEPSIRDVLLFTHMRPEGKS